MPHVGLRLAAARGARCAMCASCRRMSVYLRARVRLRHAYKGVPAPQTPPLPLPRTRSYPPSPARAPTCACGVYLRRCALRLRAFAVSSAPRRQDVCLRLRCGVCWRISRGAAVCCLNCTACRRGVRRSVYPKFPACPRRRPPRRDFTICAFGCGAARDVVFYTAPPSAA